jgi:hypothetical protein
MPTKLFIVGSIIILLSGCLVAHQRYAVPTGSTDDIVKRDYWLCVDENPYARNLLTAIEPDGFMNQCMRDKGYKLAAVADR